MAVKSKLVFEIDHGDLIKLDQAKNKWDFKDYQGFLRFVISLLLLAEEKSLTIKLDGLNQKIVPADHLLSKVNYEY